MPDPEPDLAPEAHNRAQDDAMSQAHDVARQAREHAAAVSGNSRKPKDEAPLSASEPDVVDRMHEMAVSGRIDMDAYAGEPEHDE